ncbi:Rap1-interacting factor 1 N terminal-domain-containing protein [Aspergillus avenaceus]|uniref:Rap1-interacting factor 1 N terminal-domain-containing protein n=1 Tax=Aspergillus avenaceus TaxID=36643 RepID=A0A5N6TPA3_ASPAV|nr:Rap1-interacting factor 1 N terminal-domain-containing protein [Aspergillus avenaceus]
MVEVIDSLPARPPTPPRTSSRMISEKDRTEELPVAAQTPTDSPFPTDVANGGPSGRHSKRVVFSPHTNYIKPPSFTDPPGKTRPLLKNLPPSNACKPTKSILKPTNSPVPINSRNDNSSTPETLAMLLDSIAKQLNGDSVTTRLDGYMQLFRSLRVYDGLPGEPAEIADKLGLVTQSIQQDLTRDPENGGPLATNLVIQALKLCAALVYQGDLTAQLSDDFKIFLVEQSITSLQDAKVSKSVASHYMSVMSQQSFGPKIMNNNRHARLLIALHDITSRLNGTAIVSQGLSVYQRVLLQNKSLFVSRTPLWTKHLIFGLLHHIKEVRLQAITLALKISSLVGPNPIVSTHIRDTFDMTIARGRKMATEISERMTRLTTNDESSEQVPQIWSAMILLLRNKKLNVDQWEHLKEFSLPLNRCFNCSNLRTRDQAIVAWNRFVRVIGPSEATNPAVFKMLIRAILSQLERRSQNKLGSQPNQLVLCSYYNLLYFAFRPSASYSQLDISWAEYIAAPSSNLFVSVPELSDRLAHVLSNMLWSTQGKVWSEEKTAENNSLAPEELPLLDCRWVRSRVMAVLDVFENILKSSAWSGNIEKSSIAAAWTSLSRALSYASSKEITPSSESMQAVAHVLGLLQRLWRAGPSSMNAAGDRSVDRFFDQFRFLSMTMISSLGSIPFTEKLLLKTADGRFQAHNTSTPTHRFSGTNDNLDSPILHLLRLMSELPGKLEPTDSYLRLVNDTLGAACKGRLSRGPRLELLRQCADLFPGVAEYSLATHNSVQMVWRATAQLASDSLRSYPSESARERDGSVSRDYENTAKILTAGFKFSDVNNEWTQLLDAFVRVVKVEKGDQEIAALIVEPLSENMMTFKAQATYNAAASLFKHSLPMAYCQHSAWGSNGSPTLPTRLIELVNHILRESYVSFDPTVTNGFADFLESLTSFLGSGMLSFRTAILDMVQQSLVLLLKDNARKLYLENGVESRVLTAYRALSSAVLNILQNCLPHDAVCLQKFESIFCAGLESSHISVAKRFLDFWNSTFAHQRSIPCIESISRAIQQLESQFKLQNLEQQQKQVGHPSTSLGSRTSDNRIDMSEKSRISFILDKPVESSYSAQFNSSPVAKIPEPLAVERLSKPEPCRSAEADGLNQITVELAPIPFPPSGGGLKKRSDVFSMIENLRSSSPPTNTPQDHGFATPTHLRGLHAPDRESGTPQTPILPVPADNEDGFLGSSPTPGTRGRAQSGSEMPSTPAMSSQLSDVPSSPPEIKSQDASSRNESTLLATTGAENRISKKKKKSKKSKRLTPNNKKRADGLVKQVDNLLEDTSREGTPLSGRLRSSAGKTPKLSAYSAVKLLSERSPAAKIDSTPNIPNCKPASPDKRSTSRVKDKDMVTAGGEGTVNNLDQRASDWMAESSGDDMETQIASQLEQDLEFAVDSDAKPDSEQAAESWSQPPVTRKRKREDEQISTPKEERRRSMRRSGHEPEIFELEELRSTRLKKSTVSSAAQGVGSPSAESAPKKQKLQSKDDVSATPAKLPNPQSNDTNSIRSVESLDGSQKRRSSRLSGQAPPVIPEESPMPLSKRARKRNSKRKESTAKEPDPLEPEAQSEKSATAVPQGEQDVTHEDSMEQHDVQEATESEAPGQSTTAPTSEERPPTQPAKLDISMQDAGINTVTQTKEILSRPTQTEVHLEDDRSATGIISSFRNLLHDIKSVTLDREAIRQIDDLMFEIRVETGEALRRHTD